MESLCDQSRALVDAEAQERQVLKEILHELERCLDDYSSFHRSFREMSHDVNPALHDYLRPLSDIVRGRTSTFCSVCARKAEAESVTLRKSASPIVLVPPLSSFSFICCRSIVVDGL